MRPGREAPDNTAPGLAVWAASCASMRPGREAPDNVFVLPHGHLQALASMRPGREAPDNQAIAVPAASICPGFNEAGARSPG